MLLPVSLLLISGAVYRLGALEAEPGTEQPPGLMPPLLPPGDGDVVAAARQDAPPRGDVPGAGAEPSADPLEDELDNQENIISQVKIAALANREVFSGRIARCKHKKHSKMTFCKYVIVLIVQCSRECEFVIKVV